MQTPSFTRATAPADARQPAPEASTPDSQDFSVLELRVWPNLSSLNAADVADVARVCALLAYRPTTGMLVPALLGLVKARVRTILRGLSAHGCLSEHPVVSTRALQAQPARTQRAEAQEHAPEPAGDGFVARLWQTLIGLGQRTAGSPVAGR